MPPWKSGNILGMRALLDGQKPRPGEADLRGFEWNYLRRLGAGFRMLKPLPGAIGGWLSPDGKRFALVGIRSRPVPRGRPGIPAETLGHDLGAGAAWLHSVPW